MPTSSSTPAIRGSTRPSSNAAFEAGCDYIDMAMHLSVPHPTDPYNQIGVSLGAAQFEASDAWTDRGLLALVGMGVEPGFSDVVARYAADHLFSSIDEIGVRDGSDLVIEGFAFAPTFSIWTTIEECLNPPIVYERDRGWFTTAPFSEPELFTFPEDIGQLRCVNVEHEEVLLMPRWIDVDRVTFKYGLGDEFLDMLTTLHKLGLDSTRPVMVRGVEVSPRDVVAAVLPNPAELGHRMTGRTCAGALVTGTGVDGRPRQTYLYQIVDNRVDDGGVRPSSRRLADGGSPRGRAGDVRDRRMERRGREGARGVLRPIRSSTSWPSTARRGRWRNADGPAQEGRRRAAAERLRRRSDRGVDGGAAHDLAMPDGTWESLLSRGADRARATRT